MFTNESVRLGLIKGKGCLSMCRILRWILLILFPFACIRLGYIYAQHHKSYITSCDRIRRKNVGSFDRIDGIIWIFVLLSPLPD
jgi:hypothetical protein